MNDNILVLEERRKFRRVKNYLPLKYKFRDTGQFGATLTRDISEGGLKIIFDDFIPLHTDLLLEVSLEQSPKIINAIGDVVWVQKMPHCESYKLGLEFQEISEKDRKELSEFIRTYNA